MATKRESVVTETLDPEGLKRDVTGSKPGRPEPVAEATPADEPEVTVSQVIDVRDMHLTSVPIDISDLPT